jgi:ribonuclease HII
MNKIILGIDEAGRGPLAGRVYAACVILKKGIKIPGLSDSKKLSSLKREILYEEIINKSLSYSIEYATNEEIDAINILNATFLAMNRAIEKINVNFDYILVDGNIYPFKNKYNGEAIIRGDATINEIMAASILAKVERDKYMLEMDLKYPQYEFYKHKGYPTKLHRDLIKKFGPSPIHRKTFKGVKEYI